MPVSSSSSGKVLSTGKPSRRMRISKTITGLTSHVTLHVPPGVTQIEFGAPNGNSVLLTVPAGAPYVHEYTREEPESFEHPWQVVSYAIPGYKSIPITLKFVRETPVIPVAVTLTTAGTVSAGTTAGTPLTYTPYVWAGDYSALEDTIWTSATEGGTYADEGERWPSIPYATGTWWKRRARAYGPTVANPLINGWTAYQDSAPRQIAARPAARTLVDGVDFRIAYTEYRPGTQSTWRTPIVEALDPIRDLEFELRATAADVSSPDPTWSNMLAKPNVADHFDMFDPGHPVASPSADAALFNEAPGMGRAGRFRVSWRTDENEPWSARSTGINVPVVVTTGIGADYTVSNSTDLVAAMVAAAASGGGKVIAMQPGNYGSISRANLINTGARITIRPVDTASPPVFLNAETTLNGLRGFTFDGIVWRQTTRDANGYPAIGLNAVRIDGSTDVTFRNCTFDGYHRLFYAVGSTRLTIEWCQARRCGMDAFSIYRHHIDFTFQNNLINDWLIDASRAQGDGFHPDALQFATNRTNNAILGALRATIQDNIFSGPLSYCQSIFMGNESVRADGTGSAAVNGHKDVIVRRNYIESRHIHGITIEGGVNFLIEGNLLRIVNPGAPNGQGATGWPDIGIGHETVSGIVRNNVKPVSSNNPVWVYPSGTSLPAGVSTSNNVRNATAVPPGWVMPLAGPYAYL